MDLCVGQEMLQDVRFSRALDHSPRGGNAARARKPAPPGNTLANEDRKPNEFSAHKYAIFGNGLKCCVGAVTTFFYLKNILIAFIIEKL